MKDTRILNEAKRHVFAHWDIEHLELLEIEYDNKQLTDQLIEIAYYAIANGEKPGMILAQMQNHLQSIKDIFDSRTDFAEWEEQAKTIPANELNEAKKHVSKIFGAIPEKLKLLLAVDYCTLPAGNLHHFWKETTRLYKLAQNYGHIANS